MSRQRSNQTGFGIIGIAIAVVAVVVLSGTGYVAYKAHKKPTSDVSTTGSNSTGSAQTTTTNTSTAATITPQGTYLDLTQVGVKFLLSSSVSDAVYAPYYAPSSDGATVFGISTQSVTSASTASSCSASHGLLGVISVTTTAPMKLVPPNGEAPMTPDNKTLFLIGNKYYQYIAPQITTDQQAVEQSFATLQSDSRQLAQSIEFDPANAIAT